MFAQGGRRRTQMTRGTVYAKSMPSLTVDCTVMLVVRALPRIEERRGRGRRSNRRIDERQPTMRSGGAGRFAGNEKERDAVKTETVEEAVPANIVLSDASWSLGLFGELLESRSLLNGKDDCLAKI